MVNCGQGPLVPVSLLHLQVKQMNGHTSKARIHYDLPQIVAKATELRLVWENLGGYPCELINTLKFKLRELLNPENANLRQLILNGKNTSGFRRWAQLGAVGSPNSWMGGCNGYCRPLVVGDCGLEDDGFRAGRFER